MPVLYARGNQAIEINPPTGVDFHITRHGSNWLWTVFCVFAFSALITPALGMARAPTERVFHHASVFMFFVMSVLYFTMASNLGWTGTQAEFNHVTLTVQAAQIASPGIRQVFYARFVGWFLAFPCFFLNLAGYCGVSWTVGLYTVLLQESWVVTLLIGALIPSSYRWGYYAFAGAAFVLVVVSLFTSFFRSSSALHITSSGAAYFTFVTLFLILYLICWGLSEGGNVIEPDSEAVFYGIIDICFFVVMGFGLLASTHRIDFVQRDITAYDSPVFYSGHHHPGGGALAAGAGATGAAVAAKEAAIHNSHHDNRHSGETATDPHHHHMATGFNQGNPAVPADAEKSNLPAGGDPGMRGVPDMSTPTQHV